MSRTRETAPLRGARRPLLFVLALSLFAGMPSSAQQTPGDRSLLPYNQRVIDGHIFAGGHPLGPSNNFANSDRAVRAFLDTLKARGVRRVVDLENTQRIQDRYARLLAEAGIERLHVPMNASKVPTASEWDRIRAALAEPVYVHCKWGADRTGAVLAKYLMETRGIGPVEAWKAVITGGGCAGPRGGFKVGAGNRNLVLWFCPDARSYPEFAPYFR